MQFEETTLARRVVFGEGRIAEIASEVTRLGCARAVLIAASEEDTIAAEVQRHLGVLFAGRIQEVRQHVPEDVAEAARERAEALDADVLVSLGGGSATGLAKAIALTSELPIVAIPTTYAGSEMTPIWGITANGAKRTGRDVRVLPRTVVYDAQLTVTLPVALSAASAMNALAHCVEAMWVPAASPISSAVAEEGIRWIARGLPGVVEDPADLQARDETLCGAYLAGIALGEAGTGLHHKIAHVLGGAFDLQHADVHSALLPYTTAFHLPSSPRAAERIGRALGTDDPSAALWDLAGSVEATQRLSDLGFTSDDVPRAAALVADAGTCTVEVARELLARAVAGESPTVSVG